MPEKLSPIDFDKQRERTEARLAYLEMDRRCVGGKIYTLYHGTSLDRAKDILKNGFKDPLTLSCEFRTGSTNSEIEQGITFFSFLKSYALVYSREAHLRDRSLPVLIEVDVCIHNFLDDDLVETEWFKDSVYQYAKKKMAEGDMDLFRYTYNRIGDRSWNFLLAGQRGWYTNEKSGECKLVGANAIMQKLGYDASYGWDYTFFGKPLTVAINHPNISVINMRLIKYTIKTMKDALQKQDE